ncbi:NERD domain-containing protein [Glaciihabitans sp. INWT7]|uniref:nuclease-related domain-containing protein n=1 Tax=Glaciihabitans sp. INWT7 TaxID=2596912 RepID=UPI001623FFB6|nr:nuclease-related domain-containing protein [Glaciihabitans sp. INWT7]QNE47763.1 NERD domain-containing protein [Glaciihabitans sp. INWT7]
MSLSQEEGARTDFAGIQALSSRAAGYAVAEKCLQVQADAEALDPSLRTTDRLTLADEAWSWYTGALAEIEVGALLASLGPDWFVRHAVPIGAGTKDVDHLVVGPGGVFAINTKHHAGASVWVGDVVLRINYANTNHLRQALADGQDVKRRLTGRVEFPVPVRSVVAILHARSITDKRESTDRPVAVIDAKRLASWLVDQPQRLSANQLELIKLAAEEPATWHRDPRAADTLRVMQRFERLVDQVGTPAPPVSEQARTRAAAARPASRPTTRVRSAPRRRTAARPRPTGRTAVDLIRLWMSIAVVVVVIFVIRDLANQPCTTPLGCLIPSIYLGFKPLLQLLLVATVGVGIIRTLGWMLRLARR